MERDNLTTSTTTISLFIVHLAGMLLHRWYLSRDDKKEFGWRKEGYTNCWERKEREQERKGEGD